jgi:hypothetical protein
MSEAPAPSEGPLTVDQAVASLLTPAETEQTPEAPEAAAEEVEQTEGEDQAPEEAEEGAEEPAEAEETEAEPEPVEAVDPPKYWSKDAKEAFAKLPPDLQAVVLAQEGPREEAAAKAKAEAAARAAEAEAEIGKVTQLAQGLAEFLPQAVQKFSTQWGDNPDWVKFAEEYGAEAMTLAKARYDADLADLQKLAAATQQAEEQRHTAYIKAEAAKLAEIAPDLAESGEKRKAVAQYLVEQGVDPDSIRHISATEMLIAHKAKLYDEAQAKLKAAPKPKPAAPAPKAAPVRPAAAASAPNPTKQAVGRFHQAPTVDNAVALLLARKG